MVSGDMAGVTTRGVFPHTPVNHTVFSYCWHHYRCRHRHHHCHRGGDGGGSGGGVERDVHFR